MKEPEPYWTLPPGHPLAARPRSERTRPGEPEQPAEPATDDGGEQPAPR